MQWANGQVTEIKRAAVEREMQDAQHLAVVYATRALTAQEWELGWNLEDKRAYAKRCGREAKRYAGILAALDAGAEWLPDALHPEKQS